MEKDENSIENLRLYFNSIALPESAELGPGERIVDIPLFLKSHFAFIKNYEGKAFAEFFLIRLIKLKEILSGKSKNLK